MLHDAAPLARWLHHVRRTDLLMKGIVPQAQVDCTSSLLHYRHYFIATMDHPLIKAKLRGNNMDSSFGDAMVLVLWSEIDVKPTHLILFGKLFD